MKEGTIGRRKELEQLVVENTPIRQLTVKILDEAKVSSKLPEMRTIQDVLRFVQHWILLVYGTLSQVQSNWYVVAL